MRLNGRYSYHSNEVTVELSSREYTGHIEGDVLYIYLSARDLALKRKYKKGATTAPFCLTFNLFFYSIAASESGSVCFTPFSSLYVTEMNWQVSTGR